MITQRTLRLFLGLDMHLLMSTLLLSRPFMAVCSTFSVSWTKEHASRMGSASSIIPSSCQLSCYWACVRSVPRWDAYMHIQTRVPDQSLCPCTTPLFLQGQSNRCGGPSQGEDFEEGADHWLVYSSVVASCRRISQLSFLLLCL